MMYSLLCRKNNLSGGVNSRHHSADDDSSDGMLSSVLETTTTSAAKGNVVFERAIFIFYLHILIAKALSTLC